MARAERRGRRPTFDLDTRRMLADLIRQHARVPRAIRIFPDFLARGRSAWVSVPFEETHLLR